MLLTDARLGDDVEDISGVTRALVAAFGINASRMDGTDCALLSTLIHI